MSAARPVLRSAPSPAPQSRRLGRAHLSAEGVAVKFDTAFSNRFILSAKPLKK